MRAFFQSPYSPFTLGLLTVLTLPVDTALADNSQVELDRAQAVPIAPESPRDVHVVAITTADPTTGALSFNPPIAPTPSPPTRQPAHPSHPAPRTVPSTSDSYAGGSDSLVARVVGAAEGTRTPDGGKTTLYEGHTDPGNGVWNRGTFSYQFGNAENLSPDVADQRQMAKIKRIDESVMQPKAVAAGVAPLSQLEELNGIDLINQAPLAVTEAGGYIERLAEAKQKKGLAGREAILEARVWAFWDQGKGGWNAPGLRAYDDQGKEASVRHDQDRRMGMIDQALAAYEDQQEIQQAQQLVPSHPAIARTSNSRPQAESTQAESTQAQSTKPESIKAESTQKAKAERQLASIPRGESSAKTSPDQIADAIIFGK